jgi:hypothetical protein
MAAARLDFGTMRWMRLIAALTLHSLVHPLDGVRLLRVAWRFRSRHWYRQFPFLPLPSRTYLRWRMHTAYGDDDAVPPAEDIVRYARWATQGW